MLVGIPKCSISYLQSSDQSTLIDYGDQLSNLVFESESPQVFNDADHEMLETFVAFAHRLGKLRQDGSPRLCRLYFNSTVALARDAVLSRPRNLWGKSQTVLAGVRFRPTLTQNQSESSFWKITVGIHSPRAKLADYRFWCTISLMGFRIYGISLRSVVSISPHSLCFF